MHGHQQGPLRPRQLRRHPLQLARAQAAAHLAGQVAVEQQQLPGAPVQQRRRQDRLSTQGGAQRQSVVVVAGQQQRRLQRREWGVHQHLRQAPIAAPALVLAEITADQQPIGLQPFRRELAVCFGQGMAQQRQRRSAAAEPGRIGEQVRIAELQQAHGGAGNESRCGPIVPASGPLRQR